MLNTRLVGLSDRRVHLLDNLVVLHHVAGTWAILLLDRETWSTDTLEDGHIAVDVGHECVLQRSGSAVTLDLRLYVAVTGKARIEGQ